MSDPLDSIYSDIHLSPAEREAFSTEREKFREQNQQRVRAKLQAHQLSFIDKEGKEQTINTGLKVMPSDHAPSSRPIPRQTSSADLASLPSENDPQPELMTEPIPFHETLLDDLARDIDRVAKSDLVMLPEGAMPRTGPDLPDNASEDEILAAMEQHIAEECGPGKLNPHLPTQSHTKA